MNDLKAYQALASQIEQVIDLLLQDHSDRLKWRTEVLQRLAELKPHSNAHAPDPEVFLTTNQAKTIWTVAKSAGPWVLTGAMTLFHFLSPYLHH